MIDKLLHLERKVNKFATLLRIAGVFFVVVGAVAVIASSGDHSAENRAFFWLMLLLAVLGGLVAGIGEILWRMVLRYGVSTKPLFYGSDPDD